MSWRTDTAATPLRGSTDDLDVRWWWIAALTAVALVLRLVNLGSGLWIDEIYSLLGSFRPPFSQIVGSFPRDNHHPFYSVLAHGALLLFGESAWSIRLPSLLFGTATVPLLYLLGRDVAGRREGFLAALLLAVSYHHVWFSQNARGYAMLACFTVLCSWLLLRIVSGEGRRAVVGYAVAAALGAWTHLTMVFVVVGHAAAVAGWLVVARQTGDRARLRRLATVFGLSALLTVVLYAPVLAQVQEFFAERPSQLRGVSTPRWAFLEGARVLVLGFSAGTAVIGALVLAAGTVVTGAGLVSYLRRHPLALGLFIAPAAVIIAGAAAARGTMYPRFFFALIGPAILIGVRGVFAVSAWLASGVRRGDAPVRLATRLGTLTLGAGVLLSAASLPQVWRFPKQDFEGAMRYLDGVRAPDDQVATVGVSAGPYRDWLSRDWVEVRTADDLARLRTGRRVWLVYTFPRYLVRAAPEIGALIERECARAVVFRGTVGGGDVLVCSLEPVT